MKTSFPSIDKRWIWIGLGLLSLIVRPLFDWNPAFTEIFYTRGIFSMLRWVYDFTFGLLPLPFLYLLLLALLTWLVYRLVKGRKIKRKFKNRIATFFFNLMAFAGGVIFLFYVLWGFNYYRVSVEQKLELGSIEPDSALIFSELELATRALMKARRDLPVQDSLAVVINEVPNFEKAVRKLLTHKLDSLGFASPGRVRIRKVFPKGALMRAGAAGIYIPFTNEGHFDAGLHPLVHPATIAHELSHGYGFGDEGTANFFAWLATKDAKDPWIRYSGGLSYWRHVAVQAFRTDTATYRAFVQRIPKGFRQDLRNIRDQHAKYPALAPILFDKIYDGYLKSQGIKEGVKSYSRVVNLVLAWRKKNK